MSSTTPNRVGGGTSSNQITSSPYLRENFANPCAAEFAHDGHDWKCLKLTPRKEDERLILSLITLPSSED